MQQPLPTLTHTTCLILNLTHRAILVSFSVADITNDHTSRYAVLDITGGSPSHLHRVVRVLPSMHWPDRNL